jgi:hypothetical protein
MLLQGRPKLGRVAGVPVGVCFPTVLHQIPNIVGDAERPSWSLALHDIPHDCAIIGRIVKWSVSSEYLDVKSTQPVDEKEASNRPRNRRMKTHTHPRQSCCELPEIALGLAISLCLRVCHWRWTGRLWSLSLMPTQNPLAPLVQTE